MAKNYFNRYIWLLETISSHGYITLEEIKSKWLSSTVNVDKQPLSDRTFFNHKDAIERIFDIVIKCDRTTNEYYLSEDVISGKNSLRDWLISVIQLNGVLNESASLQDRILFEGVHSGYQHIDIIISAMKANVCVLMTYQGYNMEKEKVLEIEPWCIRLYGQRWYLIGHDTSQVDEKEPHTYMLERASRVKYSLTEFELPADFNANEYFQQFIGVHHDKYYKKPLSIRLKVSEQQSRFFNNVPLHNSQTIISTESDGCTIFGYYLIPNFEFMNKVRSYGQAIEVLAPAELREKFAEEFEKICEFYAPKSDSES